MNPAGRQSRTNLTNLLMSRHHRPQNSHQLTHHSHGMRTMQMREKHTGNPIGVPDHGIFLSWPDRIRRVPRRCRRRLRGRPRTQRTAMTVAAIVHARPIAQIASVATVSTIIGVSISVPSARSAHAHDPCHAHRRDDAHQRSQAPIPPRRDGCHRCPRRPQPRPDFDRVGHGISGLEGLGCM